MRVPALRMKQRRRGGWERICRQCGAVQQRWSCTGEAPASVAAGSGDSVRAFLTRRNVCMPAHIQPFSFTLGFSYSHNPWSSNMKWKNYKF